MSSIAAIKIAQKQLGLDDETCRAKNVYLTGKPSTKDMTFEERSRVLTELHRLGAAPTPSRRPDGRRKLTGKYAGKLQALWIAAHNLGITHDREDGALEAFVRRQTGLERERFLHHAGDARKVIEALKGWMSREGGVDWQEDRDTPDWARPDGYKIARAQWALLVGPTQAHIPRAFWEGVVGILGHHVAGRTLTPQEWIVVMNELGRRVRSKKGLQR